MANGSAALVTDPFLISILSTTALLRTQTLNLLDVVASQPHSTQDLSDDSVLAISRQHKLLYAYLSKLRTLNREAAHRVRQTKQETAESRSEVDRLHLQLQNLYYEQSHLRGEIRACEEYPHPYMQLPMAAEDDFLETFQEHKGNDESTIMRARIENEYQARVELEDQRQGLLKRKQELMDENAKRKDELGKLDRDLETFIEAAKPIQKIFEREY